MQSAYIDATSCSAPFRALVFAGLRVDASYAA
jgi:hypothetical protein